jgi:hypothetical protein
MGADLVSVESRDTDDRVTESARAAATTTLRGLAITSAITRCVSGGDALSADGLGSGELEPSDAVTSGDEVEPLLDDSGVEGAGELCLPVGGLTPAVDDDGVLDSAADLASPLLDEGPEAVFDPVVPAECLPAPFDDDGPWPAPVVRDDLVADTVSDSSDLCVDGDGALEVPADAEAPEPSEPVLSAWATPDPLARAAPTPRVIAPAPSQP